MEKELVKIKELKENFKKGYWFKAKREEKYVRYSSEINIEDEEFKNINVETFIIKDGKLSYQGFEMYNLNGIEPLEIKNEFLTTLFVDIDKTTFLYNESNEVFEHKDFYINKCVKDPFNNEKEVSHLIGYSKSTAFTHINYFHEIEVFINKYNG
jgi:hypothetical protein